MSYRFLVAGALVVAFLLAGCGGQQAAPVGSATSSGTSSASATASSGLGDVLPPGLTWALWQGKQCESLPWSAFAGSSGGDSGSLTPYVKDAGTAKAIRDHLVSLGLPVLDTGAYHDEKARPAVCDGDSGWTYWFVMNGDPTGRVDARWTKWTGDRWWLQTAPCSGAAWDAWATESGYTPRGQASAGDDELDVRRANLVADYYTDTYGSVQAASSYRSSGIGTCSGVSQSLDWIQAPEGFDGSGQGWLPARQAPTVGTVPGTA